MSELERLRAELRRSATAAPPVGNQWSKLASDTRARIGPRRRTTVRWIASAIAMTAIALLATWRIRGARAPEGPWVAASDGGARQSLDDGTTISLAPGARGKLTEVRADYVRFELGRGRAQFDVTPNRRRTFQVAASGYEIRVLGTRFDVEVLAEGEPVSVGVERGSVSVAPPGAVSPIVLGPGDRMDGPRDRPEVHRNDTTFGRGEAAEGRPAAVTASSSAGASDVAGVPAAPSAGPRSGGRNGATREAPNAMAADWFALYRDAKYAASIAAARASGFQRLLRDLDAEHLAALADAARFGGDAPGAAAALTALEQRFPGTTGAALATFLLGRLHALGGDAPTAIADFERYLHRHPAGTYATEAMGRLAELYSKRGNRQQATEMARRYLDRAPDGPYARLARSLTNP